MTYAERESIFSKESLSINDISLLLGIGYDASAKLVRDIKRALQFKGTLRLDIQGKIHAEDYFEYFNITDKQRYVRDKN